MTAWYAHWFGGTTATVRPIRGANLLKSFKRLLERHRLETRRFHDLLHSTASLLHGEKMDIKAIQETLGHGDVNLREVTFRRWARESGATMPRVRMRLDLMAAYPDHPDGWVNDLLGGTFVLSRGP